MKVKGLAVNLGTNFGDGSVAGDLPRAAEGFLWRRFRPRAGGLRGFSRFLDRRGRRRSRPACCRGAFRALGFWWARVDDESKRRRQGLVVCRATLPFEGFCDARPGVTLAPTFADAGLAACQSRTVRV
jgi:hypothetical protein